MDQTAVIVVSIVYAVLLLTIGGYGYKADGDISLVITGLFSTGFICLSLYYANAEVYTWIWGVIIAAGINIVIFAWSLKKYNKFLPYGVMMFVSAVFTITAIVLSGYR